MFTENMTSYHAWLQNLASGPVDNARVRLESWTGGFDKPGRIIDGVFK